MREMWTCSDSEVGACGWWAEQPGVVGGVSVVWMVMSVRCDDHSQREVVGGVCA